MKKKSEKKGKKSSIDLENLKHWKNVSTKAKLEWLEDAIKFAQISKKK